MKSRALLEIFGKHTAEKPRFLLVDPYILPSEEYTKMLRDATDWNIKRLRVNEFDYTASKMYGHWLIGEEASDSLVMFRLKYGHCLLRELSGDEMGQCIKYAKYREIQSRLNRGGKDQESIMDHMYVMGAKALGKDIPNSNMFDLHT